ncbi:GNAT family N-acetyltransferase [Limosilactobacillus agrestis]|uniref:GNAT family N-acetyltransferase n=1 Tax=Limosilactobacillus agrestis TaxID=2759748 RepID=A0ABS8R730_9LACO|nr:GNAT family N-acetyltransferase [Limosilactobacillus agrestis]MBD5090959.1 GNAT family N-acetyltransferase [Lactobacillus sp.]MBB1098839.1 GNAT family N-acetyltransferase [Limosilactobacillus agrestis]MCD7113542.1 GNAT family N-acetyltransferase [Limosilactobacillus agrestis]MCD7125804.1 GNAT family N-acetyltransferase [Limosilactobacillus agrestis]MCD7130167.1 GNAT family N-acetyltransferase [Limosilactobacillus agrestis]
MSKIIIESAKSNNNLEAIVKLLDDEKLTQTVGLLLPLQRENRVQAIKMFVYQNHVMVVKLNEDVVGIIVLSAWYGDEGRRIAHHYELGYLLRQDQWNKGIMTSALQKFISILPSKITIHAECKQSNYRSKRVLIKCGFIYDKDDLWQRIIK